MSLWIPASSYINITGTWSHGIGAGPFTVCAWMFPTDSLSDRQALLLWGSFGDLALYHDAGNPNNGLYTLISGAGGYHNQQLRNGKWQWVAFTRINGRVWTYVDGVRSRTSYAAPASISDSSFRLGESSKAYFRDFGVFKAGCGGVEALRITRGEDPRSVLGRCVGWWPCSGATQAEAIRDLGPLRPALSAAGAVAAYADGNAVSRPDVVVQRRRRRRAALSAAATPWLYARRSARIIGGAV